MDEQSIQISRRSVLKAFMRDPQVMSTMIQQISLTLKTYKLLTPAEVAELLGVRESTIYQWTHQGFIPHVKLGRFVRFREADIARWLDERSENGRATLKVELTELGFAPVRKTAD